MKSKYLILSYTNLFKTFLISLILVVLNIIFSYLLLKFGSSSMINLQKFDLKKHEFIEVVFIAPIIETIIFQYLIINQVYLSYKGKNIRILAIIISSLTFGLTHLYNIKYFLFGIIFGFILATSFCNFKEKTNYLSAIFYVFLIHSLSNLYVFLIKTFSLL